jgi:hypothetical protein
LATTWISLCHASLFFGIANSPLKQWAVHFLICMPMQLSATPRDARRRR